jgi:hypothetical protein
MYDTMPTPQQWCFQDGRLRHWFLSWTGASVSIMRKGRVGMQRNGAYNAFEGLVTDIAAASLEDATESAVKAKLASVMCCSLDKILV